MNKRFAVLAAAAVTVCLLVGFVVGIPVDHESDLITWEISGRSGEDYRFYAHTYNELFALKHREQIEEDTLMICLRLVLRIPGIASGQERVVEVTGSTDEIREIYFGDQIIGKFR